MSTLTQPQTAPKAGAPVRLISLPLALTFLVEFSSLTSFFLLLSALPMLAAAAGSSSSGAGLITGSLLLGTVRSRGAGTAGAGRAGAGRACVKVLITRTLEGSRPPDKVRFHGDRVVRFESGTADTA